MSEPNEKAIERDFCAGVLSQQAVADKYGITLKALRYMAKKHGWVRVKVPAAVREKTGAKKGKKSGAKKKENCPKKNAPQIAPDADERESLSAIKNLSEYDFDPREYGLNDQQHMLVVGYLSGMSKFEAYQFAGYKGEGKSGEVSARQIFRNLSISQAIRDGKKKRLQRLKPDLDLLLSDLIATATADPNELTQYRRVNCRYCWGDNHHYQWRDIDEQLRAEAKASMDGKPPPDVSGGIGFISNDEPNPDCPRCNGEGEGELHLADTNNLSRKGQALFAGAKMGKYGVEVLMHDRAAARRDAIQLITRLGLDKNDDDIPKGLNDFYADNGKTKPESGVEGVLDDSGEE